MFQVAVSQIIPNDLDVEVDEAELPFSDDEDDERVYKLVSLINDGSRFRNQMFEGRASKEDIARMREALEAAAPEKNRKKKEKSPPRQPAMPAPSPKKLSLSTKTSSKAISSVPPPPKENYTACDGNQSNTTEECDPKGHPQTNPHLPSMPANPSDIINSVIANVQKSYGVDNNNVHPVTLGAAPPAENQPTYEDDHVPATKTSTTTSHT
ncbi:hypothetical protein Bca4012_026796 [Brassica carinata]